MAIRIITDAPRRFRTRRLLRAVAVLLGVLLLAVALIAGAVALVMLALVTVLAPEGDTDASAVAPLAGAAAIAVVGTLVGLRLLRGKRRFVLFLRRFGLAEATQAVTAAVTTAMGRAWRVVTLDDAEIAPVGVPSSTRRSLALTAVAGLAVLGAGMTWFVASGGLEGILDAAIDDATSDAFTPVDQAGSFGEALEALFTGFFTTLIVVLVVTAVVMALVVLLLVVTVFFGVTGVFLSGAYVRARRAERRKRAVITTREEIETVAGDLARRSRRIIGARLTVLKVAHPVWRDAVRALAGVAPVVLIDVSEPTPNLLWEVETLRAEPGVRWVLIGERTRLEALAEPGAPAGRADPVTGPLATLLDGETVLAYRPGRRDMRRFARALRASLDAAG